MALDRFDRKLLLLVEDEPLIAYEVERDLRNAGARVITAGYLDAASYMTQHPDLSGAVVDFQLGDETAVSLWRRLVERCLPFVIHTGYSADAIRREWPLVPIIQKPALSDQIPNALSELLGSRHKTHQSAGWYPTTEI
jgi:ActR/RegA family two-component response regulator